MTYPDSFGCSCAAFTKYCIINYKARECTGSIWVCGWCQWWVRVGDHVWENESRLAQFSDRWCDRAIWEENAD